MKTYNQEDAQKLLDAHVIKAHQPFVLDNLITISKEYEANNALFYRDFLYDDTEYYAQGIHPAMGNTETWLGHYHQWTPDSDFTRQTMVSLGLFNTLFPGFGKIPEDAPGFGKVSEGGKYLELTSIELSSIFMFVQTIRGAEFSPLQQTCLRILDFEEEDFTLDMRQFSMVGFKWRGVQVEDPHACGTSFCLAGWLAFQDEYPGEYKTDGYPFEYLEYSQDLVMDNNHVWGFLFSENWPNDLGHAKDRAHYLLVNGDAPEELCFFVNISWTIFIHGNVMDTAHG